MAEWLPIAAASECPPGTSLERVVGNRIVALGNIEGVWHAMDGLCPHQGGPLGTGKLCGALLTCPWHGWQFDLPTGRHRLSATVIQPRFDVREAEGMVLIRVEAGTPVEVPPADHAVSGGPTA